MEKRLMKGNEALAETAMRVGCKCFFGYPITPQTEISAYLAKNMPERGGVFLQSESEVAAINMVLGAACTGTRVMTSSSSPGISLMSEGVSYIAGSDVPCVIVNVQRGGPGLGGIQPSQSDYWQATKALGHGDFQMIVLAPCSVQEIVDMTVLAFDKAEEYRVPVMILADGLLGQMMEPVIFPEDKPVAKKFEWATDGHENKREHNVVNTLFLQPDVLEKSVDDRFKRYEKIIEAEQRSELFHFDEATEIAVVAYGACARVVKSAVRMAKECGINAGLIRPKTLWPFPDDVIKKNAGKGSNIKHILAIEMSKGQMVDDVRAAVEYNTPVSFYGRHGGVIPTPIEVLEQIKKIDSYLNGGEE